MKKTTNQNYRLVSWYECGDEPVFTQSGTYDFTLTGAGTLHTIGLETCLKPDFPWIDMNSCISGMNETLALLTFQRLNPVNDSVKMALCKLVATNWELLAIGFINLVRPFALHLVSLYVTR